VLIEAPKNNIPKFELRRFKMSTDFVDIDRVDCFSALFPNRPWQATTARKQHVDVFGVAIKSGETYYGQRGGKRYRLSGLSMERLLYIFLDSSPALRELAEELYKPLMSVNR
jgi:hypothetical protein